MTFNIEKEDRALNQYWYSPKTISAMVSEIELHGKKVAFLSTPSVFFALTKGGTVAENAVLFEFDRSFGDQIAAGAVADGKDGDAARKKQFCFFDYNAPDKIPMQHMGQFDYIVVDPPFITAEVWAPFAQSVSFLLEGHPGMKGNDLEVTKGKVMFTSILENHNMLEEAIDGPLFISMYMPSIPHLVYQYYIFTNYPASSQALQSLSTEVLFGQSKSAGVPADEDENKVLRAIMMANDLRESEVAFTQQVRNRNRDDEEILPALARQQQAEIDRKNRYVANDGSLVPEIKSCAAPTGGAIDGSNPLLNKPIDEMRWSHVPDGLTEFANADPSAFDESSVTDFGDLYNAATKARSMLDEFKKGVDSLQRHCDTLLKLKEKASKAGEGAASATAVKKQFEDALAVKKSLEESMRALKVELETSAELKGQVDSFLVSNMESCVVAYETTEIDRSVLQPLAADATRKFKSPVFNRQKELLQEMKAHKAAAIAKAKEAWCRAKNKEAAAAAA